MKSSDKKLNPSKIRVNIITVNYNAGDHLLRCLQSVRDVSDEADVTHWVVDNNSTDDSISQSEKKFSKVKFIKNKENLGFGKANNQVLNQIDSGFVLTLNPDTVLKKGTLKYLLDYLKDNNDVGACTAKVVYENGAIDWATHRGFPTPLASFKYYFLNDDSDYHLTQQDLTVPHEIDAISGAFFLTRAEVLKKVGVFDEDYFMYAEDIDLCYRIKKAGFKVMYIPEVEVLHYKGISSGLKKHSQGDTTANMETRVRSLNAFYSTMKIFYKKNLASSYPFFLNWLVYLGIDIKWWMAKRSLTV